MPPSKSRPWRALAVLGLIVVVLYVVMFATSTLTPRLGLDLRGGTSITLTARPTAGQGGVTKEKLDQATQIIASRVSGSGVTEPEITTQGSDNIVIAVPGVNADQIVKLVGQTAELRFRQVLALAPVTEPVTSTPTPSTTSTPKATTKATPKATAKATPKATAKATAKGSNDRYPAYAAPSTSATPTPSPTASASVAASPGASTPAASAGAVTDMSKLIATTTPPDTELAKLDAFTCDKYDPSKDNPNTTLLACDRDGTAKYLLGPAIVLGTEVGGASAGIPQNQATWGVQLDLKGDGVKKFGDATTILYTLDQPLSQFAIVLDGRVISDPVVNGAIPGGQASITGNFTQETALDLANVLKYGALPLRFEVSSVDSVSPLLGADQLRGSLFAGAIGLLLVILYCFFYYRGLGVVVVASLGVAAAITYAAVCLLGKAQGLTLTLAGIAGLIVSIGITADSFIVYFERLRDEVRDGRSLRTSVESGWLRARRTILASDSISLLAAVVLYALSIGSVRGFAYTLGLTTLVDLVVVMLFTKPMVTLLARTEFFGNGHRFSGLDPERLGTTRAPIRGGRGRARKQAAASGTNPPDAPEPAIVEG